MDLQNASQAHAEWKVKLRTAITRREQLDARSIGADNCCALGQWLHGDGRRQYGTVPQFVDLVTKHAAFHREAGTVATTINLGDYDKATRMLDAGSAYVSASSAVGSAILGLKKQITAQA